MPVFFGAIVKFVYLALAALLAASPAFSDHAFPTSPDQSLTPGSLCDKPSAKRYPEGIPYCSRGVGSEVKREVIATYDSRLGYSVQSMDRAQFKIDHYIPLCMGGSNRTDNLWPQHQSIYVHTDPLEQLLCEKMAAGRLSQRDALEYIRRAKANPKTSSTLLNDARGI